MAVPRVFISSTFYDLKQVRNNIGDFIKSLGYEPVMHERSGVAYTQTQPLEDDCYHELASCDIVVCIIGNHFGSPSMENDLSITMNELRTAISGSKKIYIFVANDVYIENRTYLQNRDSGCFKSAYTDNIKIHEFIAELKDKLKSNVIASFDTTDQIVEILKEQFAGLFQNYLAQEVSMRNIKMAQELEETIKRLEGAAESFQKNGDCFFDKFKSTIFASNMPLQFIQRKLGLKSASFFAKDVTALDEVLRFAGYQIVENTSSENIRQYIQEENSTEKILILRREMFNSDGSFKDIRSKDKIEQLVFFEEKVLFEGTATNDDDLPF